MINFPQNNDCGLSRRKVPVEILRCLLMLLIVCTHAFHHGLWANEGRFWSLFFIFIRWHVPAFVAISGWFGIHFSIGKVLRLWALLAFYGLLSVGWRYWNQGGEGLLDDFTNSGGWFAHAYIMLMLVSGFLNAGTEKLAELGIRRAWCVWGLAAVGFTLSWAPKHLFTYIAAPEFSQCSFLFIAFIYVTARLIRLTNMGSVIGKLRYCIIAQVLLVASVVLYGAAKIAFGAKVWTWGWTWSFTSPFVYLTGIVIVAWVTSNNRKCGRIGRIFAWMAPSMFPIYVIHETTSFGRLSYMPLQTVLSHNSAVHPLVAILVSAVVAFVICLAIDLVRRLCVFSITKILERSTIKW